MTSKYGIKGNQTFLLINFKVDLSFTIVFKFIIYCNCALKNGVLCFIIYNFYWLFYWIQLRNLFSDKCMKLVLCNCSLFFFKISSFFLINHRLWINIFIVGYFPFLMTFQTVYFITTPHHFQLYTFLPWHHIIYFYFYYQK